MFFDFFFSAFNTVQPPLFSEKLLRMGVSWTAAYLSEALVCMPVDYLKQVRVEVVIYCKLYNFLFVIICLKICSLVSLCSCSSD